MNQAAPHSLTLPYLMLSGGNGAVLLIIAAFVVLMVLLTVFWIWMLVDVATADFPKSDDKIVWVLIVILTGWVGAIAYYLVQRPKKVRSKIGPEW